MECLPLFSISSPLRLRFFLLFLILPFSTATPLRRIQFTDSCSPHLENLTLALDYTYQLVLSGYRASSLPASLAQSPRNTFSNYFDPSEQPTVRRVFHNIAKAIRGHGEFTTPISCLNTTSCIEGGRPLFAYVHLRDDPDSINLCPNFFELPNTPPDPCYGSMRARSWGSVLLHELLHIRRLARPDGKPIYDMTSLLQGQRMNGEGVDYYFEKGDYRMAPMSFNVFAYLRFVQDEYKTQVVESGKCPNWRLSPDGSWEFCKKHKGEGLCWIDATAEEEGYAIDYGSRDELRRKILSTGRGRP